MQQSYLLINPKIEIEDISKSSISTTCNLFHKNIQKIVYNIKEIEIIICPKCNNRIVETNKQLSLQECYYYHGYTNKVNIKC